MTSGVSSALCAVLHTLFQFNTRKCWTTCWSGGMDSQCVLHAISFFRSRNFAPSVLYINHQAASHPFNCHRYSHSLASNHKVFLSAARIFQSTEDGGVEVELRMLRYKLFNIARPQLLLLGHNLNDQVETLVMHFKRGSGFAGLSGIPRIDVGILGNLKLRLIVKLSRSSIRSYSVLNKTVWLEDPTNRNNCFVRSLVRRMLGNNIISRSCCEKLNNLIMVFSRMNTNSLTFALQFRRRSSIDQRRPLVVTKSGGLILHHFLLKSHSHTSIITSKQMEGWRQMMLYCTKSRNNKRTWLYIGEDKILRH